MSINEKHIIVFYIGTENVNNYKDYIDNLIENNSSIINDINLQCIIIPTLGSDIKIECINPVYITDLELIKKHKDIIDKLNYHIDQQFNKK